METKVNKIKELKAVGEAHLITVRREKWLDMKVRFLVENVGPESIEVVEPGGRRVVFPGRVTTITVEQAFRILDAGPKASTVRVTLIGSAVTTSLIGD
jgi:hypothetical protein